MSGETGFYNCEDIFDFVNETLVSPWQNVVLLFGRRRIGQASILHRIPRYLQSPHDCQVVFFDLRGEPLEIHELITSAGSAEQA